MSDITPLFQSFLQAGFECSTHRNRVGKRLDLIESTRHDCFAARDYARLLPFGIRTVRTAARWHLVENSPGQYDFRSLKHLLDAAYDQGIEVALDLLHFGWPDHIDALSPTFPERFARFTRAAVRFLRQQPEPCRFIAPVNEVSFLSWAGADKGCIAPYVMGRADDLKRNLIRAAVAGSEILLNDLPGVRLVAPEPVIHIIGKPEVPGDEEEARRYTNAMFEAWDLLSGRMEPELGGRPEYLDVVGINFYERNQWVHNDAPITREHPRWRPFHQMLEEVWRRYRRPLLIAETGTEDDARAGWFRYVCQEVRAAIRSGVPVKGICLYPILNHSGWDDDRHCFNGLFDYADENGHRAVYQPLADAILSEQENFAQFFEEDYDYTAEGGPGLPVSSPLGFCFSTTSTSDEPIWPREEGVLL